MSGARRFFSGALRVQVSSGRLILVSFVSQNRNEAHGYAVNYWHRNGDIDQQADQHLTMWLCKTFENALSYTMPILFQPSSVSEETSQDGDALSRMHIASVCLLTALVTLWSLRGDGIC